ncbi:MAG TPA: outer membrane beta-barrel protein [Polyangia bacterium]|nr:outer membrane beta-barrel protein [Polyangia bacterium]
MICAAAPSIASAQVMIEPAPAPLPPPPPPPQVYAPPPPPAYYTPRPRVYVAPPPPPVYYYGSPGAMPPHVYIRERIRWHLRHWPRVVIVPPPPPPIYEYAAPPVAPLPPIPPPVIVPPPCCYSAPAVEVAPQEVVLVKPRPQVPMWSSRIGLGVRGTGQVINDGWNNLGIGGELLYRVSPHLSTELAAEYQRSTGSQSQLDRVDIPVTFGLRVHIGRPTWVVSPYFVFAGGVAYAQEDYRFTTDDAIYVEGQLGGGLELRLGQHVAITADARLDAKKRANGIADNVLATTSVDGKPVHPLGDEVGGQFRLGVAVYF